MEGARRDHAFNKKKNLAKMIEEEGSDYGISPVAWLAIYKDGRYAQ